MHPNLRLPAFYRLDPQIGWKMSAISSDIGVNPVDGTLELGFAGTRLSPLTDGSGAFGGLTLPTGVAVGPDGVVVVANPQNSEILYAPHQGLFGPDGSTASGFVPLWSNEHDKVQHSDVCLHTPKPQPNGPYNLVAPRGVAFSKDGDLLVSDEGDDQTPGRLLVYTWPGLQVRTEITLGGRPWDIAVGPDGHIFVADIGANKVLRFDRGWRIQSWLGGTSGDDVLNRPRHLTFDQKGQLYVVDQDPHSGSNRLVRLDALGRATALTKPELADFWASDFPPPIQERDGKFYAPGTQCLAHGRPLKNVHLDVRGRLPQGPVLRYVTPFGQRKLSGVYYSEALDSETFAFTWHRMLYDMDLGQAGAIEVQTYTAAQYLEPSRIHALPDQNWSRKITLTPASHPEITVQSQGGRYLWFKLRLIGDGQTGPTLRAIDIIGPRKSSLRFLPAPFHEDPVGRDFLDRFLSYFDTIFDEIDYKVSRFSAQLTPQGAPEGRYLAWLGSWFDIRFLAVWPDETRRAFLENAMALHRTRGTIAGLSALIRLHLGTPAPMPVIIEGFRLRHFAKRRKAAIHDDHDGGLRIAGRPLTEPLVSQTEAHHFAVIVPAASLSGDAERATLIDLVDQYKPAHTVWSLIEVDAALRIGCQSTIGVDTLLGSPSGAALGDMHLGQTAHLTGPPNRLPRIGQAHLNSSH